MRVKGLLKKLKLPEEEERLWFSSDKKIFTKMKKSIEEMIGGWQFVGGPHWSSNCYACARNFHQQLLKTRE
ncbi:hypothetical protein ACTXT7_004695 [Hymenolepis weldensis]